MENRIGHGSLNALKRLNILSVIGSTFSLKKFLKKYIKEISLKKRLFKENLLPITITLEEKMKNTRQNKIRLWWHSLIHLHRSIYCTDGFMCCLNCNYGREDL